MAKTNANAEARRERPGRRGAAGGGGGHALLGLLGLLLFFCLLRHREGPAETRRREAESAACHGADAKATRAKPAPPFGSSRISRFGRRSVTGGKPSVVIGAHAADRPVAAYVAALKICTHAWHSHAHLREHTPNPETKTHVLHRRHRHRACRFRQGLQVRPRPHPHPPSSRDCSEQHCLVSVERRDKIYPLTSTTLDTHARCTTLGPCRPAAASPSSWRPACRRCRPPTRAPPAR